MALDQHNCHKQRAGTGRWSNCHVFIECVEGFFLPPPPNTHTHMHTHTHAHTHAHTHTHTHTHKHTRIHSHVHVHMHTLKRTHVHTHWNPQLYCIRFTDWKWNGGGDYESVYWKRERDLLWYTTYQHSVLYHLLSANVLLHVSACCCLLPCLTLSYLVSFIPVSSFSISLLILFSFSRSPLLSVSPLLLDYSVPLLFLFSVSPPCL